MPISDLRNLESAALSKWGKINVETATALVSSAKTPEEKAVLRDMLAHDAFEPKARGLVTKNAGAKAARGEEAASGLAGSALGTVMEGGKKVNVSVVRELGPTAGYQNKLQALGHARASGVKNAVVMEDAHGRFHTVETNIASAGLKSAKVQVPGPAISKQRYESLQTALKTAKSSGDVAAQKKALVDIAVETWGVKPEDVNFITSAAQMDPTKINLQMDEHDGVGNMVAGFFGPADLKTSHVLPVGKNAAKNATRDLSGFGITITAGAFLGPATDGTKASGVLLHESTHLAHAKLGNEWLAKWQAAGGPGGKKSFEQFMAEKGAAGKEISSEDAAAVAEQGKLLPDGNVKPSKPCGCWRDCACTVTSSSVQTELTAGSNEAMAKFERMDPNSPEAAEALGAIGTYRSQVPDPDLSRLRAFRARLDVAHRTAFDARLKDDFMPKMVRKN